MIDNSEIVTNNINQEIKSFLKDADYQKVAIIVDENTEAHCLPLIADVIGEHWLLRIRSGVICCSARNILESMVRRPNVFVGCQPQSFYTAPLSLEMVWQGWFCLLALGVSSYFFTNRDQNI